MAKIVKYCGACDEGFAEKFTFCPTCGGKLEAFELNPLAAAEEAEVPVSANEAKRESSFENITPLVAAEPEVEAAKDLSTGPLSEDDIKNRFTDKEIVEASAVTEEIPVVSDEDLETLAPPPIEPAAESDSHFPPAPAFFQTEPKYADEVRSDAYAKTASGNDGYHITVIEEKNTKQRNSLLLASFALMIILALGGTVYSIFNKALNIGAIGDDQSLAYILDDVPMPVEEVVEKKNDDEGGGGGGGGREEKTEASLGDMANQTPKPLRAPDAKTYRSDNFELKMDPASTQGNQKFEQKYNRYGALDGLDKLSNGTGTGGGLGDGDGLGQGSGRGTGAGSGSGSGYGSGEGTGNGPGKGPGDSAPPAPKAAPAKPFRILSKPKAPYTDEARQNNVQGKVILRVTFLASGQIGTISTVKGLPNGLTEKAIAAARMIKFETGKTVTRTLEYSFTIY
jgi:hypothetical protein